MENNNKKYYTAGEFAERAGVTIRTIRYYDSAELLKPSSYSESGYRLYCDKDFAKLQKILTLKYLGLSLSDIKEMLNEDVDKNELKESLKMQRDLVEEKISHMQTVLKSIEETEDLIYNSSDFMWEEVIKIIDSINLDKEIINQYKTSQNLKSRINIHDKFSTNKYGWHRWVFDKIQFKHNMRILEIGCGNGELWKKNKDRLPQEAKVYLTDKSEGMIEDAKNNLKDVNYNFIFAVVDSENIPYEDEYFDIVIANHVIYHIKNKEKALKEISRVLKADGSLVASTIGINHMKELENICSEYNSEINLSCDKFPKIFGLENGQQLLDEFFEDINIERYDDSLVVTEANPLMDYIFSTIGNVKEVISGKEKDFEKYIENKIEKNNGIVINKYSGMFIAKK